MEGIIRQGDVWLIPLTAEEKKTLTDIRTFISEGANGPGHEGLIVAAGEATGHHHRVRTRGARMYTLNVSTHRAHGPRAGRVLRARRVIGAERVLHSPKGGATITHEEHAPLDIPAGDYKVVIAQEYVPQAAPRRVYD